jgi:hypothetical protein
MNAKTPLAVLSVAAILLSAQAPQEAIPAFEAVAMAPASGYPIFEHQLHLSGQNADLRLIGGNTGDFVAIVLGVEETHVPLPGTAVLRVNPLAMYIVGEFDVNGEFEMTLIYEGKPIAPASVLVQGFTLFSKTGLLGSSNYGAIDFDGSRTFEFRDLGP